MGAEEPFDPSGFLFTWPAYLVKEPGGRAAHVPLGPGGRGGEALVVFTDGDLAGRYAAARPGASLLAADDRRELLLAIHATLAPGGGHVAVDPGPGRARVFTVEQLVDILFPDGFADGGDLFPDDPSSDG